MPFALRWLQAQLPLLMGKRQEGAAQLYNLLDFCQWQQSSNLEGMATWAAGHTPPNAAWFWTLGSK